MLKLFDACISMKHVHASYIWTHNILKVTHTLAQVEAQNLCPNKRKTM